MMAGFFDVIARYQPTFGSFFLSGTMYGYHNVSLHWNMTVLFASKHAVDHFNLHTGNVKYLDPHTSYPSLARISMYFQHRTVLC
jgi:hypothetical protein